jgi:hypothetical protein
VAELDPDAVERLSANLHAIYQDEARRQAGTGDDAVRHPDDYAALPERTKEYDRVLARYILQREAGLRMLLWRAREWMADEGCTTRADIVARGYRDLGPTLLDDIDDALAAEDPRG